LLNHVYLISDGGYRNTLGIGVWAYTIRRDDGEILDKKVKLVGGESVITNNVLEYSGVVFGLESIMNLVKSVTCISDSQLIIEQLRGNYAVKNHELRGYYTKVQYLACAFEKVEFVWRSREDPWLAYVDNMGRTEIGNWVKENQQ
jgi:ribonuclease HI